MIFTELKDVGAEILESLMDHQTVLLILMFPGAGNPTRTGANAIIESTPEGSTKNSGQLWYLS